MKVKVGGWGTQADVGERGARKYHYAPKSVKIVQSYNKIKYNKE